MRIALLTTRQGPQAARFAALCGELAARGHAVAAVCPPEVGAALAPAVRHLPWRAGGAWWNPFARASLALALTEFSPDLVHAYGDKAAALAARVARKVGPWPLVASLAGRVPSVARFDRVLLPSPAALARFAASHPGVPAEALFPAVAPPALGGAGAALRDFLAVPWGVPVALACLPGGDAAEGSAAGAAVGAAFAAFLTDWEWVGEAELWVVGDGGPQAEAWRTQCRNLGLLIEGGYERGGRANGIRWLGRRDDADALLAACDFLVSPGAGPGQTEAVARALLAGKPAVAAGHPWAGMLLPADYAVPADDAPALRQAVAAVVSDVERARAAQAEAFARAAREWTPPAMAEAAEAAYVRTLCAAHAAR